MTGDARFSPCGRWRWWLTRVWDEKLPMAALIGMNPSTADAKDNDPTVAKEIHFVRSWGFGGMFGAAVAIVNDDGLARERAQRLEAVQQLRGNHATAAILAAHLGGRKVWRQVTHTNQLSVLGSQL